MSKKIEIRINPNLKKMPIEHLVPYAKNPRKIQKGIPLVVESIKSFGFNVPITINNMKVKPKVGDFYMFPNWLDHQVYPFRSKYKKPDVKGERRSFSLNIIYQNVKEDRNKN